MAASDRNNVVVTGVGCVTPIGNDVASFWRALLEGRSGAARILAFDATPYRTQIGCEVKGFDPPPTAPGVHHDPATLLAIAAAREALSSAGLNPEDHDANRMHRAMAVAVGTTMGAPNFLDCLTPPRTRADSGADADDDQPWKEVLTHTPASIAAALAKALELGGPQVSLPAACSAGNYAVGYAFDLLRQGDLDIALAGGAEAFSESALAGFSRLNAVSPDVCRPFDRNRRGLLLGAGAGFLVLENETTARRRGAPILARVLGYGLSCDAYHITGPHPDGEGAVKCMVAALEDARLRTAQVDYISCHGTGTRHNDSIETKAIRRALGPQANQVAVSSIKALTGHMMGAASAVEAISCVLALRHQILPPTWNLLDQDPECDLDVVPNKPRSARVKVALNNSYAFGGNNACLALAAS